MKKSASIWFSLLAMIAGFAPLRFHPPARKFQEKIGQQSIGQKRGYLPAMFMFPQSPHEDLYPMQHKKRFGRSSSGAGAWAPYQMVVNGSGAYSVGFPDEVTCSATGTSCTMALMHSTVAGDLLYFGDITYNGSAVYISSVYTCATLSSGICTSANAIDTASLCASHGCAVTNSRNDDEDQAYVLSGAGGATYATFNFSTTPSGGVYTYFREATPPAGTTVSYDTEFTTYSGSCTTGCTGTINTGSYTLSGDDVVLVTVDSDGGLSDFNSPWTLDRQGTLSLFNVSSLTTPTFSQANIGGTEYFTFAGIAFKASAYRVSPAKIYTVNDPYPNNGYASNYSAVGQDKSCSPSCTLTVSAQPSSGDLLYVQAQPYNSGSAGMISSASFGSNFLTVPSGSNTCSLAESGIASVSCAYLLSAPTGGGTSLTVTMSASGTYDFRVYDVSRSSGSFALDAQRSIYTSTAANPAAGPALTLSGTDDIIFTHEIFTTSSPPNFIGSLYAWLPSGVENFYGTGSTGGTTNGWSEVLPNTTNGGASSFYFCATSGSGPCPSTPGSAILANAVAFK